MPKEKYWSHYEEYLEEMLQGRSPHIHAMTSSLKKKVERGCTLEELKLNMLEIYEPISIMQWLEQWEIQMELFLYTPITKLRGRCRGNHNQDSTKDFMDGILIDTDPQAHICNQPGFTQLLIFQCFEMATNGGDDVLEHIRKKSGMFENWELMMLQGDLYKYNHKKKQAKSLYEALDKKSGYRDASVKQALFTLMLFP